MLPGGTKMIEHYTRFRVDLPAILARTDIEPHELIYNDDTTFVAEWLMQNSPV